MGANMSAKRKISLFRKIVLLAANFFLRLWLRKRSFLKSFSGTKKVFFMNIFLKEKFAPMSSQPTNELNEHVCHWEENSWVVVFFRFFESGSFFSLFFSSFCLFCCPKMETVFRVIFFYLFRNSEGAIRGHQFIAVKGK